MKSLTFIISLLLAVTINAQDPIRGVWITNSGSSVLNSRLQIREAVMQCKDQRETLHDKLLM